jgi:hypothetical protein
MTRSSVLFASLALIGWVSVQSSTEAFRQSDREWTTLFDGSSLDGWNVLGDGTWEIVDGAVQGDGEPGFLVTAESYGDFQLTFEYWIEADTSNSGVFIRCADPRNVGASSSYEVNIADRHENPDNRTGSIVGVTGPAQTMSTAGKWNTYDITANGSSLTVLLNGITTADAQDSRHISGPIALQHRAGLVKFRNVRIRLLEQ